MPTAFRMTTNQVPSRAWFVRVFLLIFLLLTHIPVFGHTFTNFLVLFRAWGGTRFSVPKYKGVVGMRTVKEIAPHPLSLLVFDFV